MSRTTTLADPLASVLAGYRDAGQRRVLARQLAEELSDRLRAATVDRDTADAAMVDAKASALRIVRALVNRAETDPTIVHGKDYEGATTEYRAAMGRVVVHRSRKDRGAAPRWTAYGVPYNGQPADMVSVYEPATGTNDGDKMRAQYLAATAAARAWLAPLTGAAWLASAGLPAVEPIGLLSLDVYARHDGHASGAYTGSAYITVGGSLRDNALDLAELRSFDLTYGYGNDRVPMLTGDTLAEYHRLTRGNVPITELRADPPHEAERRIGRIRDLLTATAPMILAVWLAGFAVNDRER